MATTSSDSSILTLAQWSKYLNDPLVEKVTFSLYESGNFIKDVPFINRKSMKANGVRWTGNLPTADFVDIGEPPVTTKGTPDAFQEGAYMIRNNIDVDVAVLEDVNNITDPRGNQIDAYMKGVAYKLNDYLINNTHANDSKAFLGLRWRIDNPTTSGVNSEMKINAGAVDLSGSGMTAATANAFLEYVDTLLSYMKAPDGDGVILYMNDLMQRRFASAIRLLPNGSGWNTGRDNYDRPVLKYRNATIQDLGRKADQTTRIITSTETTAGADGSGVATSIYGVKYGQMSFFGWQYDPLKAKYLGVMNDGVTDRTIIDYRFGLMQQDTRAIGRIYNIKVA